MRIWIVDFAFAHDAVVAGALVHRRRWWREVHVSFVRGRFRDVVGRRRRSFHRTHRRILWSRHAARGFLAVLGTGVVLQRDMTLGVEAAVNGDGIVGRDRRTLAGDEQQGEQAGVTDRAHAAIVCRSFAGRYMRRRPDNRAFILPALRPRPLFWPGLS